MFKRVVTGIFRHGRQALEGVIKRPQPGHELRRFTQLEVSQNRAVQRWSGKENLSVFGRFVTRYTSQCLAAELRRKAALQFQSGSFRIFGGASRVGQPLPLFAFLSVGLAAGVGIQRSEADRYDPVCEHIKGLFLRRRDDEEVSVDREALGSGVADYTFGRLIAKGCHAAVYEASVSQSSDSTEEDGSLDGTYSEDDADSQISVGSDNSDINTSTSEDESFVEVTADESDHESFVLVSEEDTSDNEVTGMKTENIDEEITRCQHSADSPLDNATLDKFELAVKMMFNYAVESTAGAIVSAMERELLPVEITSHDEVNIWQNGRRPKKKRLPPHPNIVHMVGCFIDDVPSLPGDVCEYPAALPTRLHSQGCGRNKTMFIVMKRYTCTLREYLLTQSVNVHESTLLLTQLMEAIVHLGDNNIAHRDLKSDNILLEDSGQCPHLVVADFGCSFTGGRLGLRLWYPTDEINKGGNAALMAPEIVSARPGIFSFLDYTKADVWAAGALAYEIFGCANPFYGRVATPGRKLQNDTYTEEDLPDFPEWVPSYLQGIVRMLLRRDPAQRPSAVCVANMLHVLLWAPKPWLTNLESGALPPKRRDVMRWLLTLSAEVMCQRWGHVSPAGVECQLKNQFLSRLNLDSVMAAVDCLWCLV